MLFFQPSIPELPAGTDLSGQTVVVTGATAGLGYEAALQYLQLRASNLILAVRNVSKGQAAKDSLLSHSSIQALAETPTIDVLQLDLNSLKSIRSFVGELQKKYNHLDIVLLNAGINALQFSTTEDGYETTLQINFLSNALLSALLLPLLKAPSPSQGTHSRYLTVVGSKMQNMHSFSRSPPPETRPILDTLNDKAKYSRLFRYNDSKFLIYLFIRQLAKHIEATTKPGDPNVVVNVMCPGMVCPTGFDESSPGPLRWIMHLVRKFFGRPVVEGARCMMYASAVYQDESKGKFINHNEVEPTDPFVSTPKGKEVDERLWEEMKELIRKEAPSGWETL